MSAGTLFGSLLQAALFFWVGWALSGVVLAGPLKHAAQLHRAPERALLSLLAATCGAVLLMVAHLVTGGAVFGTTLVVPAVAVAVLFWGRGRMRSEGGFSWRPLVAFAAVVLALYFAPVVFEGSSVRTGDPPWHLGWSEQLLAGEPVPEGPAADHGRNAYPWGWHAVIATMTRLVPGSDPLVAHEALHLLLVLAIPLAAACLARAVAPRAGWAAAAASSLVGGFGWVVARGPDFVTSPADARYGADLVVASPNSVYELMPPALPREFGLVALAATGVLVARAVATRDRRIAVAAGVAAGVVGLVSVPLFVAALLWLTGGVLVARDPRVALCLFGPAVAVFLLWAGPVVSSYVRFGGFVNITPELGQEWPLHVALSSWGLLLPLAIVGVVVAARAADPSARAVLAFSVGTVALLALAIARGAFEWGLGGNATLLHQGRVWPPAHLLGAAFAGVALQWLYRWGRRRVGRRAVAGVGAILALGAASPVLAADGMAEVLDEDRAGFVYAADDVGPGSFVRRAADVLGPEDVVQVEGSRDLAFFLFQFSGVRLAHYDDPRLGSNDLRIRYADLARRWNETIAAGGFRADYLVLPAAGEGNQPSLVRGAYKGDDWVMIKLSRASRR